MQIKSKYRSSKTALNGNSFVVLSYLTTSNFHLILEDFVKKNGIKKLCKKSFENKLCEILNKVIKQSPLLL